MVGIVSLNLINYHMILVVYVRVNLKPDQGDKLSFLQYIYQPFVSFVLECSNLPWLTAWKERNTSD